MSYRVCLGVPGTSFMFETVHAILYASRDHEVIARNSGTPGVANFNAVWCSGLNLYEAGEVTHFAMIHSDIAPESFWLDILIAEMDRLGAALVSVAAPIKDGRGLVSSGIGDPNDRWTPFRRWTMREVMEFPETWSAADAGYPGGILLHNNAMWVADLRYEELRKADERGHLVAFFDYPARCRRADNGEWVTEGESEDWYFSRMLHELGLRNTYVSRKTKMFHRGSKDYHNWEPWGAYQDGDRDTAAKWQANGHSNGKGKSNVGENTAERGHGGRKPAAALAQR